MPILLSSLDKSIKCILVEGTNLILSWTLGLVWIGYFISFPHCA